MPRNVRPVWADLETSDGRKVGTGPRGRDGSLSLTVYVRDGGTVRKALTIHGSGSEDGGMVLLDVEAHGNGWEFEAPRGASLRVDQ